ncbi:MAG: metallopeptidase family protein [Thermoflexales bacterium]|nr:metallopeptidase family protein [Thermoflexales bacterium]MDW8351438.1 metallopeptidase family protein [Anaerolineae bacterium]
MLKVSREQFERLVWEAIDELPEAVRNRISNLEIEVKVSPSEEDLECADVEDPLDLYGLYRGVPLTERTIHYDLVTPDLITIYQRAHEAHCNTLEELREEVRRTVRHEIAHHFGIDDDRLDELGAY